MTGPENATEEKALRVLNLVAAAYGCEPDSFRVETVEDRPNKGFLHPVRNLLPDGREATVTGWYF